MLTILWASNATRVAVSTSWVRIVGAVPVAMAMKKS